MVRCPYCFDDLDSEAVACTDCGTALHRDCRAEHGRCVVLGCRPRIRVAVGPQLVSGLRRGAETWVLGLVVTGLSLLVAWAFFTSGCCYGGPDARRHKVMADRDAIRRAADCFRINNGRYPHSLKELWEPRSKKWDGPLIDPEPRDPWGNQYVLAADGRTAAVSVESLLEAADR